MLHEEQIVRGTLQLLLQGPSSKAWLRDFFLDAMVDPDFFFNSCEPGLALDFGVG
jgi:hypothetical protein